MLFHTKDRVQIQCFHKHETVTQKACQGKNIAVTLGHQLLSCHCNSMFIQDTKVQCELEYKKVFSLKIGCVQVKILILFLFHATPCCSFSVVYSHQCEV